MNRKINDEQLQQILKMTDNLELDMDQIREKLLKILGEPQNNEEETKVSLMTKVIGTRITEKGSVSYFELSQRENKFAEIEKFIKGCCWVKAKLIKILEDSKKWDINDMAVKSWHPIRILNKFLLLEIMNRKLCSSCQELKENLANLLKNS